MKKFFVGARVALSVAAAIAFAAMVLAGFASCSKSNSASASGGGGADTPKKEAVSKKADGAALAKKIQALEAEKKSTSDKIMKEEIDKNGMTQYAGEQAGKRIYEAEAKIDQQLKPLYEQVDNLDDGEYRKYAEAMGLITEPEYVYKLSDDGKGVVITAYNGLDSTVNIPAEIEGFPVVQVVGEKWGIHNKRITAVVFPDTVTDMKVQGLPNLKEVTLPKTLRKIRDGMFKDCKTLESFAIPDGVTSIGSEAFRGCANLASVTIPDSVKEIGRWAFLHCSSLASVTIPVGVTAILYDTFSGCSSLASVSIPSTVEVIYDRAFANSGLTSIVIPEGVKTIGAESFSGCTALTSVTIPDSAIHIGWRVKTDDYPPRDSMWNAGGCSSEAGSTFVNCSNLVTVNISPIQRLRKRWHDDRWPIGPDFAGCPKLSLASQAALKAAGCPDL